MKRSEEIKKVIRELELELHKTQEMERREKAEEHLRKLDAYLIIFDKHDRTTCSDDAPVNTFRCNRCTLLSFNAMNLWDLDWDVSVSMFRV